MAPWPWEPLRELVRLVSVAAAGGGVALLGVPGAKRAVLLQRRIADVKASQFWSPSSAFSC